MSSEHLIKLFEERRQDIEKIHEVSDLEIKLGDKLCDDIEKAFMEWLPNKISKDFKYSLEGLKKIKKDYGNVIGYACPKLSNKLNKLFNIGPFDKEIMVFPSLDSPHIFISLY
jgi:hypothetical protein